MKNNLAWLDDIPRPLAILVRFGDKVSECSGKVFAWLVIPLMLGLVYEVIARYVFSAPTKWAYDLTYNFYGALFMLVAGYTLFRRGHVRTDFVYRTLSDKWQGILDCVQYIVFFLPAMICLFWVSLDYTIKSWMLLERAAITPWMPPIYPLKTVVPLGAALLIFQGIAELIRSIYALKNAEWPDGKRYD